MSRPTRSRPRATRSCCASRRGVSRMAALKSASPTTVPASPTTSKNASSSRFSPPAARAQTTTTPKNTPKWKDIAARWRSSRNRVAVRALCCGFRHPPPIARYCAAIKNSDRPGTIMSQLMRKHTENHKSGAVMNPSKVLVVEDDGALREALSDTLQLAGYSVVSAADGSSALDILAKHKMDIVVSDVQMQPMDGNALLKQIKKEYPTLPVVLITAYGTVEKAVSAMHEGAADYLVKPFEADVLVNVVDRYAQQGGEDHAGLIAHDIKSCQLVEIAKRVAETDVTVMISGESGTGKEVFARFIHTHSRRGQGPFVAINCAAIPENMLEAVLFGYE